MSRFSLPFFAAGLSQMLCQVLLCQSLGATEAVLEMKSEDWKYLDTNEAPGKDWMSADFDDSQWKTGQAPFGYGDDDIEQNVSFGDDTDNKHLCYFFRRIIQIEDPSTTKQFQGQLVCDDGCAIYINGEEVHRHNLPTGELSVKTLAPVPVDGGTERYKFTFLVAPERLQKGNNIIAVRVHQRGKQSTDLAFDVSLAPLSTDDKIAVAKQKQAMEKEAFDRVIEELKNRDQ